MQPHDPTVQALAERVAKLEAQNRRLRTAGMVALVAASAVVVMGQERTSRVLEANELVLKDNSGTVRARLSVEDITNKPSLDFYGEKNHISASLTGGDEPFLTLWRAGTNEHVLLRANSLGLHEKEIRAGISLHDGSPGLELYDESGKPRVSIESSKGAGEFILLGGVGDFKESSMFRNSALSMWGKAGMFTLDLGEEGPSLALRDKEGYSTTLGRTELLTPATGRTERTPAASVVLFGKDKKVLWAAP